MDENHYSYGHNVCWHVAGVAAAAAALRMPPGKEWATVSSNSNRIEITIPYISAFGNELGFSRNLTRIQEFYREEGRCALCPGIRRSLNRSM